MTEEEVAKPGFENNAKIRNFIMGIMKLNKNVLISPYLFIGVSISLSMKDDKFRGQGAFFP